GHELPEVVYMLNELLVSMGRGRAATISILQLDPEAEQLEAISAGHLPPLLIESDGAVHALESHHGMPVGVRTGQRYHASSYRFPTGSSLPLCTDGLIERRGEPIDEGLQRLTTAARTAAQASDSSLADRVYRRLLDETPLEDDVALLAIETM